jgi:hypothetical protein
MANVAVIIATNDGGRRNFLAWAEMSQPEPGGYERSLTEMEERGLLHGRA